MAGARATVRCASLRADGRVLVTLDKDFGELAILHGVAHAGIVDLSVCVHCSRAPLVVILQTYASELAAGALITAEPGRVRVRL
jgi:predicted nuclease of predicted toxin-antitoxin system